MSNLSLNLENVPESEFFDVTVHGHTVTMDLIVVHQLFAEAVRNAQDQYEQANIEDRPWLEEFTRKLNEQYSVSLGSAQAYVIATNVLNVLKVAVKN